MWPRKPAPASPHRATLTEADRVRLQMLESLLAAHYRNFQMVQEAYREALDEILSRFDDEP